MDSNPVFYQMTMGDHRSDDHLKIFKCLVDTGADVLRSTLERKVLNNNAITFEQYLDNVKHQFYHQFEKNRNKPSCSQSPHVNCNVNGNMDKKIFEKVYNKTSELDTHQCLDRFKVKGGVSTDKLDLSDLNFFLWNSKMLSPQEKQSLQAIMKIRSNICHPESTNCYSITELERVWLSLEKDILLFAEPYRYKKMVTLQIATLKKYKVPEIESEKIIIEMATESEKIILEMKQEVQTRDDCTKQLMKEESVGVKNCIKDTYDKTKLFINEKAEKLAENHRVLTTRCIEEIKTTVTEDGSNTRLHNEDQRRAIDSHLTESENRVCQTVIQSGGRLEDKLTEQNNEIRKHNVELNADLMEENRKLTAVVMEMKTDINELKTILIGNVGKQKVQLVMNTEQIKKSTELPDNGKVEMTLKVNQTHVTEDKENEIIENLPPDVEIQNNNDSSPDAAVTETVEITGKKINSIILELKATPGILHSVDTFIAAILGLVQVMQTAGGIDVDIEDTVTVSLKFESPLTEDQFAVVKCLSAKEWKTDNDTTQLLDECSSISDEYLSTADVDEIESLPELDIYSRKDLELENSRLKHVVEDTWKEQRELIPRVKDLKMENSQLKEVLEGLTAEISKLKDDAATSLVNPFQDDIGMISKTEKLGMKQKISTSHDFSSSVSKHTYGLTEENSKLKHIVEDLRKENKLLIHVVRGLEENSKIKDLYDEDSKLRDLLKLIIQNTGMIRDEETEELKDKELQSDIHVSNQKSELIKEGQKGLAIIVNRDRGYSKGRGLKINRGRGLKNNRGRGLKNIRDPDKHHLQDFFEEIGFVVKLREDSNYAQLYTDIPRGNFYCVFLVLISPVEFEDIYPIQHVLRHRIPGKPVIVITDFTSFDRYPIRAITTETNTLMAMSLRREGDIFQDFIKVTRSNRFADIMDILTRMNALYDRPTVSIHSTLREKFCFF